MDTATFWGQKPRILSHDPYLAAPTPQLSNLGDGTSWSVHLFPNNHPNLDQPPTVGLVDCCEDDPTAVGLGPALSAQTPPRPLSGWSPGGRNHMGQPAPNCPRVVGSGRPRALENKSANTLKVSQLPRHQRAKAVIPTTAPKTCQTGDDWWM